MIVAPEDAFGDDADDAPPVDSTRPTARPRTVRARQRRKEEARAAALAAAMEPAGEIPPPSDQPPPPQGEPASAELVMLAGSAPPADPLEAQAWLHRAMVTAAREAILDPTLAAADRRKELRAFAKVAAVLLPDARRWQAEEMIRADARPPDERHARGPDLEAVPAVIEMDDGDDPPQPG